MVEQTIGFVAGIPLCLSAMIDKNNIMIHVADAGIMKVLATFMFSIGTGVAGINQQRQDQTRQLNSCIALDSPKSC